VGRRGSRISERGKRRDAHTPAMGRRGRNYVPPEPSDQLRCGVEADAGRNPTHQTFLASRNRRDFVVRRQRFPFFTISLQVASRPAIKDKLLKTISDSRRPLPKSACHPANAGLYFARQNSLPFHALGLSFRSQNRGSRDNANRGIQPRHAAMPQEIERW
jgi:hypothetical protein